jgi:hypothetical protein
VRACAFVDSTAFFVRCCRCPYLGTPAFVKDQPPPLAQPAGGAGGGAGAGAVVLDLTEDDLGF